MASKAFHPTDKNREPKHQSEKKQAGSPQNYGYPGNEEARLKPLSIQTIFYANDNT